MAKSTRMTFCSFCGKAQNEVRKMIAGPAGVHICDSCVSVCKTIIDRELSESAESAKPKGVASSDRFNLLKPAQITAALDEHIISQDYANRALAVAVYNHYKRLKSNYVSNDVELDKSNILLKSFSSLITRSSNGYLYCLKNISFGEK